MSDSPVVRAYLAEKGVPILKVEGKNLYIECPNCKRQEFAIHEDTWMGQCWRQNRCGFRCNERTFKRMYGDVVPVTGTDFAQMVGGNTDAERFVIEAAAELQASDVWLQWLKAERGWTDAAIRRQMLGLGVFPGKPDHHALVYPYFSDYDNTQVVNAKLRLLPVDGEDPKLKDFRWYLKGTGNKRVYNEYAITDAFDTGAPLFVCEGEADAVTLISAGFCAIGVPGAESVRSALEPYRESIQRLQEPDTDNAVVFVPDNDTAGSKAADTFRALNLPNSCVISVPAPHKDVTEWFLDDAKAAAKLTEIAEAAVQTARRTRRTTFGDPGFTGYRMGDVRAWPELEFIVPQFLMSGGLTLVYAAPGAGKSTLVKQLVRCVATGDRFLDLNTMRTGIVFFELDEPVKWTVDTLGKMGLPEDAKVVFIDAIRSRETFAEDLAAYLHQNQDSRVVVIDTLNKVSSASEINSYSEMDAEVEKLKGVLRQHPNVAMLVIHHANKAGTGALGSQAIDGAADIVFEVTRDGEAENVNHLRTTKARVCKPLPKLTLLWNPETHLYSLHQQTGRVPEGKERTGFWRKQERQQQVLELLAQHSEGLTKTAVHRLLKGKRESMESALATLVASGDVVCVNSVYRVAPVAVAGEVLP
jgi:hypothetical protein